MRPWGVVDLRAAMAGPISRGQARCAVGQKRTYGRARLHGNIISREIVAVLGGRSTASASTGRRCPRQAQRRLWAALRARYASRPGQPVTGSPTLTEGFRFAAPMREFILNPAVGNSRQVDRVEQSSQRNTHVHVTRGMRGDCFGASRGGAPAGSARVARRQVARAGRRRVFAGGRLPHVVASAVVRPARRVATRRYSHQLRVAGCGRRRQDTPAAAAA